MSKEYRKMMKKYKKSIRKLAKEASKCPWDWGFGVDVFVEHLRFMRDYYALGENVFAAECNDVPSRERCLNMILAEYDAWQNCDEKYFNVFRLDEQEELEKHKALGYHIEESTSMSGEKVYFVYKYADKKENSDKNIKEYQYHREKFFELLSTYLEYLWD